MGRRIRASLVVAAARFDPRSQETSTGAGEESGQGAYKCHLSCFRNGSWRLQVSAAVKELQGSVMKVQVAAHLDDIITKPLLTGGLETFKRYSCSKEYSYRDMSLCMNPLCFSFAGLL
ncbi:unnamed protein product [Sphagnum jensenii]|uniref:Uncharacterized protein n=1 Tax=Sphagnum jensenii TaxID=128206 RepID=A0ABP0XHB0_9BRYO